MTEAFLAYLRDVRRYSPRTQASYRDVLEDFAAFCEGDVVSSLTPSLLRSYEADLMQRGLGARTINQHISALSSFCRFLMKEGVIGSNPARGVKRPKMARRLPEFYREEVLSRYLEDSAHSAGEDELLLLESYGSPTSDPGAVSLYRRRLSRLMISLLYGAGIRRAELIGLQRKSFDAGRSVLHVRGKGDKMREIPLVSSLCHEICLYLRAVVSVCGGSPCAEDPLLVTEKGRGLYPAYVDRVVKAELESAGITGKKSPHVLRHSLATSLLDEGGDLNAIKEMLGHSSLAATQVYTHNSVQRLKKVYNNAHPRAKNGGKYD